MQSLCEQFHLTLVSIDNENENAFIAAQNLGYPWIGAKKNSNNNWKWSWAKVHTWTPISSNYQNWGTWSNGTAEPNGTGDCAFMSSDGTWWDSECTSNQAVICKF